MNNSHRAPRKFLNLVLFFAVAAGIAVAQDVVKVSPQNHKVLLENDRVRVLSVRLKPGEKAVMHSHPASVIYYLSDAKVRVTYPDGKTQDRECRKGSAVWAQPVTHAVENIGTTDLLEVQTELKTVKQAKSK
jgi:quercetin dioxygenase-like cupin family protein